MPERGTPLIHHPEFDQWPELIRANSAALASCAHASVALRSQFRQELRDAGAQFEQEVKALADRIDVEWSLPQQQPSDLPVLMAGHQPVIYHPGLFEKTAALSSAIPELPVQRTNVIIDTDGGADGVLIYPTPEGIVRAVSIASPTGLALNQKVIDKNSVQDRFATVIAALTALKKGGAVSAVSKVAELYARCEGAPLAVAASLLRRLNEAKHNYFEVPFSRVVLLPSAQKFIAQIVQDGANFHKTYNALLDAHRTERKIKNVANPFPNLRMDGGSYELPVWVIDKNTDTRTAFFSSMPLMTSTPEKFLAPRGALITILLRTLGSDLFIHGLGGAKYEPITDLLLEKYIGLTHAKFAVVSANRYLFNAEIARYEDALKSAEEIKRVSTRPSEYIGRGSFTADEETALRSFSERRNGLIQALNQGKEKREDVKQIGMDLKTLDNELRTFLNGSSFAKKAADANVATQLLDQWYTRSYPYFLYE